MTVARLPTAPGVRPAERLDFSDYSTPVSVVALVYKAPLHLQKYITALLIF